MRQSPCTDTNSKWIKDVNIKPETLKLLQGNKDSALYDTGVGKDFLIGHCWPRNWSLQLRSGASWDEKSFCQPEKQAIEWKGTPQNGQDLCHLYIWQDLNTEYIKNSKNRTNKSPQTKKKNVKTDRIWIEFSKYKIKVANNYLKTYSSSITIRKMQFKRVLQFHFPPLRRQRSTKQPVLERIWERGTFSRCLWIRIWSNPP